MAVIFIHLIVIRQPIIFYFIPIFVQQAVPVILRQLFPIVILPVTDGLEPQPGDLFLRRRRLSPVLQDVRQQRAGVAIT